MVAPESCSEISVALKADASSKKTVDMFSLQRVYHILFLQIACYVKEETCGTYVLLSEDKINLFLCSKGAPELMLKVTVYSTHQQQYPGHTCRADICQSGQLWRSF